MYTGNISRGGSGFAAMIVTYLVVLQLVTFLEPECIAGESQEEFVGSFSECLGAAGSEPHG